MDPYIESSLWSSFHTRLIVAILDQLNPRLPTRYIASNDLYVWRVDNDERILLGEPDVYVSDRDPSIASGSTSLLEAPVVTVLPGIVRKQRYIEIFDKESHRVVTVIEILSPANKTTGENGRAYRMKREEYLSSGVSLVEIDLLRSGHRPPLGEPVPVIPDYYILVHRGWEESRLGIWPVSVRDPLPPVPIPLDPDVPAVTLNLRACIDHVYDFGRFSEQIDYTQPPKPPLHGPDASWARDLLAQRMTPTNGTVK